MKSDGIIMHLFEDTLNGAEIKLRKESWYGNYI